jgi:hypothetical protein
LPDGAEVHLVWDAASQLWTGCLDLPGGVSLVEESHDVQHLLRLLHRTYRKGLEDNNNSDNSDVNMDVNITSKEEVKS